MPPAAEEQRDASAGARRDNAGREQPGATGIAIVFRWRIFPEAFSHQFQNSNGRIVVVQNFALSRLPNEFLVSRSQQSGGVNDVPLG